jgi:shikimate dehydrogenase
MDGETRLHLCIGDPIAQVKSPEGLTREFSARGVNAACIPVHVSAKDVAGFMAAIKRVTNVDGVVITVPHKFAAFGHCERVSGRARFLSAVNVMRRERDGHWFGDMTDGIALLAALRARGFEANGERALVVGAGGAGSAVALALVEAGIGDLAVCDTDAKRCDDIVGRLNGLAAASVRSASADPYGYGLIVNATPVGMSPTDPLPVDAARIDQRAFVADLITRPAMTPLLECARRGGALVVSGDDMFLPQRTILADFLLGSPN